MDGPNENNRKEVEAIFVEVVDVAGAVGVVMIEIKPMLVQQKQMLTSNRTSVTLVKESKIGHVSIGSGLGTAEEGVLPMCLKSSSEMRPSQEEKLESSKNIWRPQNRARHLVINNR